MAIKNGTWRGVEDHYCGWWTIVLASSGELGWLMILIWTVKKEDVCQIDVVFQAQSIRMYMDSICIRISCFFGSACLMLHHFIMYLVLVFFRILKAVTTTTSLIPSFRVVVLSFWQDSNVTFSQVLGTLPFIALQRQVDPGNTWEDRGS